MRGVIVATLVGVPAAPPEHRCLVLQADQAQYAAWVYAQPTITTAMRWELRYDWACAYSDSAAANMLALQHWLAQKRAARARIAQQAVHKVQQVSQRSPPVTACASASCLQQAAQAMGDAQFGAGQGACVIAIVDVEDPAWSPTQSNLGGSGAYGLPQANPGGVMASAGPDWATNGVTQLRWMVQDYIPARYGTACNALAHERTDGWY
jgi:hypothetical protein